MIFKPYTAMSSIRSPPVSLATNTSNPISSSNGCCVSGLCKRCPLFCYKHFCAACWVYHIYVQHLCMPTSDHNGAGYIRCKNISNSISCSNGACVRRGRCRKPYYLQAFLRLMCLHARHARAQTLNPAPAGSLHC